MTTPQEITFNEYTEKDEGWFDRLNIWQDFLISSQEIQRVTKENNPGGTMSSMADFYKAQRALQNALFSRCNDVDLLKAYFNQLPPQRISAEITRLLAKIGFFNPAPKNS